MVAPPADRPRHFASIVSAAAVCVTLGVIVTYGWAASEPSLTRVLPGARAMQPLTAVGLIIVGATLAAFSVQWRKLATAEAILVIGLGLQAAIQSISGADFGTDTLLFESETLRQRPAVEEPGRTSLLSALLFVLFGCSCLLIFAQSRIPRRIAVASASVGIAISLLSLIGFILLSGEPVPGIDAAIVMPLHTALGLAIAFAGLLLVRPSASWVRLLLNDGWTGQIARLLLVIATVPIPVAWAAEQGHRNGFYGADIRMLLIVLGAVLLLAILGLRSAFLLGRERRERDELARALDQSASLAVDEHGTIIYWSRGCEQLYGWSADEAKGRRCQDLLGDCGPIDMLASGRQGSENGVWRQELRQRSKDGRDLTVFARCIIYSRGEQRLPTALLSLTDMTEEQRAQNELLKRDETLIELQRQFLEVSRLSSMGELAAGLAHELNQPLTATANFLGAAEMALQKEENLQSEDTRQKIHNAVTRAKEEALRGGEIVRRLRDFISRGEADTKTESLSELVNEAVLLALPPAIRKSIDVRLDLPSEADLILADRIQIQQVVINLVKNSAEAMAGQTTRPAVLTIASTLPEDETIEVSVSDTGPGLAPDVAANLFAPFTSSKATGMGVGLSICKRIVEAHGGRIWLEPGPDGGTSFHFTLPAMSHPETDDEE